MRGIFVGHTDGTKDPDNAGRRMGHMHAPHG